MKKIATILTVLFLGAFAPLVTAQDAAPPAAPPAPTETPAAAPAAPDPQAVAADTMAYFNNVAPTGPLVGIAGPGHNGFLMICAALVLFMTLPGLALFYGGLVRHKNVLSVMAQCLGLAGMVTIMWFVFGYSFVFGEHPAEGAPSWAGYVGNIGKYMFLADVGAAPNTNYTAWPSHATFSMYQLMFAIITPALIVGAIAERMKFAAIMAFCAIWMVLVYFPMAHMVWQKSPGSTSPAARWCI
jgi:Amt family ammonium transporter